jgi:small-conductance mechanosensitive channel
VLTKSQAKAISKAVSKGSIVNTTNTSGATQTSLVDTVLSALFPFVPLLVAFVLVISALIALHYLLLAKQSHLTSEQKLPRQVGMLVLTIVGAVVIAMTLPVSESTRNQVIALIGVLISGVIAFSSTTMVGNLMAGIVLRVNRPFRVGDFIKVEGYSGRVTEMGLLDVEIQTESRELIVFANTLMVNSPVAVTRASGAIVSVDISLGYDIHHSIIEEMSLNIKEPPLKLSSQLWLKQKMKKVSFY